MKPALIRMTQSSRCCGTWSYSRQLNHLEHTVSNGSARQIEYRHAQVPNGTGTVEAQDVGLLVSTRSDTCMDTGDHQRLQAASGHWTDLVTGLDKQDMSYKLAGGV